MKARWKLIVVGLAVVCAMGFGGWLQAQPDTGRTAAIDNMGNWDPGMSAPTLPPPIK